MIVILDNSSVAVSLKEYYYVTQNRYQARPKLRYHAQSKFGREEENEETKTELQTEDRGWRTDIE